MSADLIPDEVKRNIRAVLLSKIGGVLVSEFKRDYAKLVNKKLNIENFGFESYKDFIEAIPEYARLEYSDKDMAFRLFGVGDPNMYMSLAAKKAQGFVPRVQKSGTYSGASCDSDDAKKLIPNARGLYTVCFKLEKARSTESDDIAELFSQAGEVSEVNSTAKWIFVRFKTKQAALSSLEMLSYLDVRIADEGKNKQKDVEKSIMAETEDERASLLINKLNQEANMNMSNAGEKKTGKNIRPNEIFIGNIENTVTNDEFKDIISELNPSGSRLVRKDLKLYAFVDFHSSAEARNAIERLDGLDIKGRVIQARMAHTEAPPNRSPADSLPGIQSDNRAYSGGSVLSGKRTKDVNHNEPNYRDKPGLLGPAPTDIHGKGDASNMAGNRSFDSSKSSSSDSPIKLSERMTELSISVDRSGKKMVTSSPHGYNKFHQQPKLSPGQPKQEQRFGRRRVEDEMPHLEETMPALENSLTDTTSESFGDEERPVAVFVANFPAQTTARELYSLFHQYKVREVNILASQRCPKAHVWLANLKMAEAAIRDLNQVEFMGRPLLLDVPRSTPDVRERILARQGNTGGLPAPKSRSALLEVMCESVDDLTETKSSLDSERNISDVLETYSHILDKMKVKRNPLTKGSHIKVMVTAAEEETFFWGQVISERENLISLKHLVKDLQNPEIHLSRTKGLGRCAALYEGEWHRAWVLKASLKATEKLKVIFVDYGNIENLTWSETCIVGPRFWDLPPMARPFIVAGSGYPDLGRLETTVIECEVTKTAPASKAMLTEVNILRTDVLQP